MSNSSSLYIKIPSHIVRNETFYLSNSDFILYAKLCFLYFRNYYESEIEVNHKKLMLSLKITDTRTLKKQLNTLYQNKLIHNEIKTLPKRGNLTIQFNGEVYNNDEHFTLVSARLFNYFENDQINEYAFRQVVYYKSHINPKEVNRNFCFVGYDKLSESLKVSRKKIKEANDQLRKSKLIKVVSHKLEPTYEYDEKDDMTYDRYNNHYYVSDCLH